MHCYSNMYESPVSTVPQTDVILPAEQLARWWRPGQHFAAAFAPQPRAVLVAVGNRLLRCGEPPGTAPGAPTLMHARPAGEEITCMATLPVVRSLCCMCLIVGRSVQPLHIWVLNRAWR